MALYNDPKTGKSVEADSKKQAVAKMAEDSKPKPSVKKKVAKATKATKKEETE